LKPRERNAFGAFCFNHLIPLEPNFENRYMKKNIHLLLSLICVSTLCFAQGQGNNAIDIYTERASIYVGSDETIVIENRTVILDAGLVVNRNIEVRNGTLVALEGSVINGNLTVKNGGSVILNGAYVSGKYQARNAKSSVLLNTTIGERIRLDSIERFIADGSEIFGNTELNNVRSVTTTTTKMHGDSVRVKLLDAPGNDNFSGRGWGFPPTLQALGTGWSFPPNVANGAITAERWLQMHADSVKLGYVPLFFSNGQGNILRMHADSVAYHILEFNLNRAFRQGVGFESNTISGAVVIWDYEHLVFNNNLVDGDVTLLRNKHVDVVGNTIGGKLNIRYSLQCEESANDVDGFNTGCPCNTTGKSIGFVTDIVDLDKGIILSGNGNGNGNGNWNVNFNEPFMQEKGIKIGDKVCYKVAFIQGSPLGSDLRLVELEE
jgi:hypothetical protein